MKANRISEHMNCSLRVALQTLAVIRGRLDPLKYPRAFPATNKWVDRCHNKARKSEIKMEALNELLHGDGVEALRIEGAHVDNFHFGIVACYINTGDTYSPTILLDHEEGKFRLTTWGDFLEKREAQLEES